MANKLIEQQLTKVKSYLSSNLSAELTTLQTAYGDGITLTAPGSDDYYINDLYFIDNLPAIQVLPESSEMELNMNVNDIVNHSILIIAHVLGYEGKEDYCAKRAYRFGEAIWRLITNNRTLDDTVIEAYITSMNYEPLMDIENRLKGEVHINLIVKDDERV